MSKLRTPVRSDVRDTLPVQPRLVSTGISRAAVGVGEPLSLAQSCFYKNSQSCGWCGRSPSCSPGRFFIGIPRTVVGVGETLSAGQAVFYRNSQRFVWRGRNPFCSPGWILPEFLEVCLAWANLFLQPRLVFTGIPRPVNKENESFYAALAAFDLN